MNFENLLFLLEDIESMLGGGKVNKKPKKRLPNMAHIKNLHSEDNKKEFQNKGISDANFIGMVKECNNDI